jgi:hypothetical protein
MLQKIHGTNFFHIKFHHQMSKWTSATPSSCFLILMVRLYILFMNMWYNSAIFSNIINLFLLTCVTPVRIHTYHSHSSQSFNKSASDSNPSQV